MPRSRAIALIVSTRKAMLSHADERLPADNQKLVDGAASLERLLLDVRAGRIDSFELTFPEPILITVSSD